jgi:hypothetical protein
VTLSTGAALRTPRLSRGKRSLKRVGVIRGQYQYYDYSVREAF